MKLTARRLRTHSSKMASFTTSVISRANALALQGYKHCCHVMLHCPVEEKLFGFYPVKHAVLVSTVYIPVNSGDIYIFNLPAGYFKGPATYFLCVLPLLEREVEYVPYILSINCRVNTIFIMTCNIMTPFLTLSISMLVPTLCDCFSSSTFPDDSGNLQSRTKALGTLLQKVLGRFPIPTPFPHHPSSLHKKRCTHISRSFLRVSALYRVGGGRTEKKKKKGNTV